MKTRGRSSIILLLVVLICLAPLVVYSQYSGPMGEPIVVKVIRLEHANAERLASILSPLLTKDGRITAYPPTNTLIIRDRKSRVEKLVPVIKGESNR
jgi:type II secretory pathway component GspD/PulD (secretin)